MYQTGSGKTYTMGTGFDTTLLPEELGVIPRAVKEIFTGIEERQSLALEVNEALPQFEVRAQFLEVCIYFKVEYLQIQCCHLVV